MADWRVPKGPRTGTRNGPLREPMHWIVVALVALRVAAGWTQEQVAGRIDVSRELVKRWENGTSRISMQQADAYAHCFNRSLQLGVLDPPGNVTES